MNKKLFILPVALTIIVFLSLAVVNYLALNKTPIQPGAKTVLQTSSPQATKAPSNVEWKVDDVVDGLWVPWSIVFTSPSRMLVTERNGSIREVVNGKLNPKSLLSFNEVASVGEAGLMGMEKDPEYSSNKYLYVCVSYYKDGRITNKLQRLVDKGSEIIKDKILLAAFPSAKNHAGCRVKFGPDGKLYVTSGDATQRSLAQDMSSLAGKILRLNSDGSIPSDNPIAGSYVYSYGHRNPQGLAWTTDGTMYETEHGPSGFDGPGGGDEINIIKPGDNYGWPIVSHTQHKDGMEDPKLVFTPAEAPSGMLYYSSSVLPQFKGNIFFAALKGAGIFRLTLDPDHQDVITLYEKMDINVGRVRELEQGPDGYIYFATSNQDGRGTVHPGDDHIYVIRPK